MVITVSSLKTFVVWQTNEAAAKRSGDDKKLQMVASRKKKLEERLGQEKNDKGHRFSRNKCAAAAALWPPQIDYPILWIMCSCACLWHKFVRSGEHTAGENPGD